MTTILFEGSPHTYLPEVPAYIRYLESEHTDVKPYISTELKDYNPRSFQAVKALAALRGHMVGVPYAEGLKTVRIVK